MNEVLNHFYHLEFTNNPYFLISKNWTPPPTYFAFPLYLAVETSVKNLFRYESEFDSSKKSSIWSLTWLTYFFTETSIVDNFPLGWEQNLLKPGPGNRFFGGLKKVSTLCFFPLKNSLPRDFSH